METSGPVLINHVYRGACEECDCDGYEGEKGPCEKCGHFPNKHMFMGVVKMTKEEKKEEVRKKAESKGLIGTPFSDKDLETKSALPIWEQTVKDEKGRKRFHGAFTGGFSAGYWNTVGSEEGWAPSEFVSSRSNRAQKKTQNTTDFMDEEDKMEELQSTIKSRSEFEAFGSTEVELRKTQLKQQETENSFYLSNSFKLDDLIVPSKEPIGIQLLKKMGYKEKQSILVEQQKQNDEEIGKKKIYGPVVPNEIRKEKGSEKNVAQIISSKMENVANFNFLQKNDTFGIGFDPSANFGDFKELNANQGTPSNPSAITKLSMSSVLKNISTTTNFGLGALEEEDDHEVYSSRDLSMYDEEIMGRKQKKKVEVAKPIVSNVSNKTMDLRRCLDGNLPLRSFRLSSTPFESSVFFEPPMVPTNFQPIHSDSNYNEMQKNALFDNKVSNNDWNAEKRGKLLGEEQLPRSSTSVFNLMSPQDKERISQLTNRFQSGSTSENSNTAPGLISKTQLTEWEKTQQQQFTAKQNPFKTIIGDVMSQRFVTTTTTHLEEKKEVKKEISEPKEFKINRKVVDWYPVPLLCKRFGLKSAAIKKEPPTISSTSMGQSQLDKLDEDIAKSFLLTNSNTSTNAPTTTQPVNINNNNNNNEDPFARLLIEDEEEIKKETEKENEKPSIDLFKAIFGEDEEKKTNELEETNEMISNTMNKNNVNQNLLIDAKAATEKLLSSFNEIIKPPPETNLIPKKEELEIMQEEVVVESKDKKHKKLKKEKKDKKEKKSKKEKKKRNHDSDEEHDDNKRRKHF